MDIFKKKSILLICPNFYHYHTSILNSLKAEGHEVTFISDYSEADFIYILLRNFKTVRENLFKNKHNEVIAVIKQNHIDTLFVIRGFFMLDEGFLKALNNEFPQLDTITYQWDSVKRFDYTLLIKYLKKAYTFDPEDALTYNINYLPLFYDKKIDDKVAKSCLYDVLFISSFTKERLDFLNELLLSNKYVAFKFLLYIPFFSFVKGLKNKWFRKNLTTFYKYLMFSPLDREKYFQLMESSRALIDFCHSHQTGLTMRSIETLGNEKILLTNNKAIKKEPFFDPKQIKLFKNVDDLNDILKNELDEYYQPIDVTSLFLSNWLSFINH